MTTDRKAVLARARATLEHHGTRLASILRTLPHLETRLDDGSGATVRDAALHLVVAANWDDSGPTRPGVRPGGR